MILDSISNGAVFFVFSRVVLGVARKLLVCRVLFECPAFRAMQVNCLTVCGIEGWLLRCFMSEVSFGFLHSVF